MPVGRRERPRSSIPNQGLGSCLGCVAREVTWVSAEHARRAVPLRWGTPWLLPTWCDDHREHSATVHSVATIGKESLGIAYGALAKGIDGGHARAA